jgi:hypothetical protein
MWVCYDILPGRGIMPGALDVDGVFVLGFDTEFYLCGVPTYSVTILA